MSNFTKLNMMKEFLKNRVYNNKNFVARFLFVLPLIVLFQTSFAQLLQQDFSGSTTVSTFANASTPSNGQFNTISTSGAGTVLSINTTGTNKLRFARTANAGAFSRTTDFSPTPTTMMYRFDLTVSGNSSSVTNLAAWQVGSGFGTGNATEANASVHSRIGLNWTTTAGQFSIRDIAASSSSSNFTGTQTITWVINNSGATASYRAPDGTEESVANDTWDLWVGTTRAFNNAAATTATQSLTDLKFAISNGTGNVDMDNLLIDPIPGVPSSSAATSITSASFQANWATVSGVTGYRVDVATDAGFTSLVSGYNNLYVSGQTTNNLSVTGLSPTTQYWYRVRAASQYTVGEFAGANSATETATTSAAGAPSLAITGTPTNHGSSCIGTPTSTVTYTITNSGTAAAGINVASSDAQFVVSGLSSTSIAGSGGTATYDVTFTPTAAGAQASTITVTSTTPGSNSPTSSLTGTGLAVVTGAVSSAAASAIVNTTATLNGNVTTLSTCPGTIEKGFVYSVTATNSNPLDGGTGVTKTSVAGLTTGAYSLNLTGLTPVTGYSYKAYIYDGVSYIYGAVETFTTLDVATQLAYSVAPPATGAVGANLTSFTVQARRADNSVDPEYTGNITLTRTIVSGSGSITGTTTVAAVAGVATFTAVQFDAAGTYTITAASGALSTVTSSNVVISLTPVTIYQHNFGTTTITGHPYSVAPGTLATNLSSSSWSNNNSTNWTNFAGNTGEALSLSNISAANQWTLTFDVASGYSVSINSFNFWRRSSQAATTWSMTINGIAVGSGGSLTAGGTLGVTTVSNPVANLTGTVTVVITLSGTGSFRLDDFTLNGNVLVTPTVSSFTPSTGYIGSSVVITGTNFTGATAVTFGGVNAASYTVDNPTQITAVVASGGATGNIVVTGATGTFGTSSTAFTFGGYGTAASGDFSTGSTWIGGSAPTTNADVTIMHDITLSTDVSVGDVALTSGKITIGSNELTIVGAVTRTSGFLEGSNTSDLVIADNAGTLYFTPGGTSNYLRNFTLNSGATATLGNELNITAGASAGNEGLLTIAGTAILTTGGNLTLRSNQFGTAAIAGNTTSSSYISGNVTVERYLSTGNGTKAWRLLSSNTSGQTINNAWQEGQSAMATNTTGYGTMITGRTNLFASEAAAQAAGFDKRTNGSSILYYNAVTDALVSLPATTVNIATYPGYFLYLRGDRSADFTGAATAATTAPTLRSTGTLFTGNTVATVEPTVTNTNGFTLVGNPFASAIDMTVVMATRTGGISSTFQVWDPKISGTYGLGGYQTFTLTGSFYRVTPGGGSYPANNGSFSDYNNVESGAAFFLQNTGTSGTVTIGEAAKAVGSRLTQRPSGTLNTGGLIKTTLFANTANGLQLADGNMVVFDDTYSNDVNTEDSRKNVNFGENFGISKAGKTLVVEQRPLPLAADTIQFTMNRLKTANYTLEILADNIPVSNRVAFLEDRYTSSFTALNLLGSTNYNFTVNADALSADAARFRIVFREQGPLPVTFTSVKAAQAGSNIAVEWKVAGQVNIASYEVMKSTDGRNFTTAGTLTAVTGTENVTYNWLDVQVNNGANYYRIKSVDRSGAVKYTEIVKVFVGRTTPAIAVSPNPVKGNLVNLQFTSQPAGTYAVRLLNIAGQVLMNKKAQHSGGSASQSFDLPSALVNGVYQLEVILPDNSKQVQKLIIDPAN